MLMLQMITQMRQSMLGEDSDDEGLGADTFSSTIDSELARHLAKAGGMGLQGAMLEAWDRQRVAPAASANPPPAVLPVASSVQASASRTEEPGLSLEMGGRISSNYGWRQDPFNGRSRFHGGIDLAARYGTDVPAAASGTVVTAGEQGGYGLTVVVRHVGGYETRYAHLSSLDVAPGASVEQGTVIGRVGSTGRSTAPHLHFEVTRRGERVDPDRFVRNLTSDTKGQ
jgi:murein DD-endopeptidase MepM/ murein hydrolase activator NlpD